MQTDAKHGCKSENAMSQSAHQKFGSETKSWDEVGIRYVSLKWCGGGGKMVKQQLEYIECHLETNANRITQ